MMDEIIIGVIEDILAHKYKVSKKNIDALLEQYDIDNSLLPEEWAEMLYFYDTLWYYNKDVTEKWFSKNGVYWLVSVCPIFYDFWFLLSRIISIIYLY